MFDASGESIGLIKAVCRQLVLQLIRTLIDFHDAIADLDWLTRESICLLHAKGTYLYHKESDFMDDGALLWDVVPVEIFCWVCMCVLKFGESLRKNKPSFLSYHMLS